MAGAMTQFLVKEHFTPDGLPREGANVTNWGPPENRNRERYLEKYGAKSDDDRNFLSSVSTNATPKSKPGSSLLTSSKPKRRKRILGLGKDNTSGSGGTVAKEKLSGE